MFSHVHVGITNFERSYAFYSVVMNELGFELKFCRSEQSWAGWIAPGKERPIFLIGLPYDRQPANAGNGGMTAFLAFSVTCAVICPGRSERMPAQRVVALRSRKERPRGTNHAGAEVFMLDAGSNPAKAKPATR